MKVVLFFLVWAVVGLVYFVYETVHYEERWSRSESHWLATLAGGPVIWMMSLTITLLVRGLMLLDYIRGLRLF